MHLSDLALDDFRSYRHLVLALEPGVTTFVGRNGQGKTNIVEAVNFLATFASHRVGADTALVRQGTGGAMVRAKVHAGGRPDVVEIEIVAGKANRARLNRGQVPRARDLLGVVRTVMFAPEDLELVRGDPSVRRRFLDELATMLHPRLAGVRADLDRVVRQRGALLRQMQARHRRGQDIDDSALEPWDLQLADLSAQVTAARAGVVAALRPHLSQAYHTVARGQGEPHVALAARLLRAEGVADPDPAALGADGEAGEEARRAIAAHEAALADTDASRERLLAALSAAHGREIARGVNLVGAHRDEFTLGLGTLPVKGYASHGETWSYALALRIASLEMLRDQDEGLGDPILILDDVFAELDEHRRERLATLVADVEQVFVTAAVPDDVPTSIGGARFRVEDGAVTRLEDPADSGRGENLDG